MQEEYKGMLSHKATRRVIGILLAVIALNAFGGATYGWMGADAIPTEWLNGTPFRSYRAPSFILFFTVGVTSAIASISICLNARNQFVLSILAGTILLGWTLVQVLMIGFVSFLQPLMAIASLIIIRFSFDGMSPR